MAQAPAGDETLQPNDAMEILEEILPAQNHSYVLGMKLKLPPHVVDAIHSKEMEPEIYLLKVISEFLNEVGSRPTWRVIVEALRSPAVRLHQLANKVEAAHFPNITATREIVPAMPSTPTVTSSEESTQTVVAADVDVQSTGDCSASSTEKLCLTQAQSPEPNQMTIRYVQAKIRHLEKRFNELKRACRACLEKCKITVKRVVDALTDLPADDVDEHKHFIESHLKVLYQSSDHSELFGALSFNMNYLSYQLLDYIADEFDLEIKNQMMAYKNDLQHFRKNTPLILFCQTQKRHVSPPADFQEVVAKFEWPQNHNDVTLEVVEQFRQEYACHYKLRACAMMLAETRPGSFIITWYIPQSIVEKLRAKVPRAILKNYDVTKLEIAGSCVYRLCNKPQEMTPLSSTSSGPSGATARPRAKPHKSEDSQAHPDYEDYPFIEQPSDDFFCPVTTGLLLQPHLTSCCGKHLSQEATARIQEEGGACPLCKTSHWSTLLNKHFQRQVNGLHVFCRHEDRGCGWKGELSDWERHIHTCPMRNAPLITDLLKSPLYKDEELTGPDDDSRSVHSAQDTAELHPIPLDQDDDSRSTIHSAADQAELYFTLPRETSRKLCIQAPCKMIRGSATTDHQFAYFTAFDSNSVYSYEFSTEQWNELPSCPYPNCALVIIDGSLTTVGGSGSSRTNKLFTLRHRQWVEKYPHMITARSHPAVVSIHNYIIVIGGGGSGRGGLTSTVELFQVSTNRWYGLSKIPQPLLFPSATICGARLHVIGWDANGYTCSLKTLLSRDETPTLWSPPVRPHLLHWTSLPHLPVIGSTAATINGQLVIIGGVQGGSLVNSIYKLEDEQQWKEIGSMSLARSDCLVVSTLSQDTIMIVGGYGAQHSAEEWQDVIETLV